MNQPRITEAAVTAVLEQRVDDIRAKARDDHAAELDEAGYSEAAAYLRSNG